MVWMEFVVMAESDPMSAAGQMSATNLISVTKSISVTGPMMMGPTSVTRPKKLGTVAFGYDAHMVCALCSRMLLDWTVLFLSVQLDGVWILHTKMEADGWRQTELAALFSSNLAGFWPTKPVSGR